MDGYSRDVDGRAIAPGGTGPLDFKRNINHMSQKSQCCRQTCHLQSKSEILWFFGTPLPNPTTTVEENTQRKMPLKKTTKLQLLKRATCASEIQLIETRKKTYYFP